MERCDLLVANCRVGEGRDPVNLAVRGSRIAAIGSLAWESGQVVDAGGGLVLPALVESRTHWDTALTVGHGVWNRSGTIAEALRLVKGVVADFTPADLRRRMRAVSEWHLQRGVLFVRAEINVSDPRLWGLEAGLAVKKELAPVMTAQLVAFPQDGIETNPQGRELLQTAMTMGAEVVGAVPHLEATLEWGVASIDFCLDLAERHGARVDVTCDETDDPASRFVERVAEATRVRGLGGRVTVSHVNAMALYEEPYLTRVIDLLARAEVNVVVSPPVSTLLQGRSGPHPVLRGLAPIKRLIAAGVNVSLSHDDVMSPFYPFGNGDMLYTANLAAHVAQLSTATEIEELMAMITVRGARTLGVEDYGLMPGHEANLVVLPVTTGFEAVRTMPRPHWVISKGRVVARTPPPVTELFWPGA